MTAETKARLDARRQQIADIIGDGSTYANRFEMADAILALYATALASEREAGRAEGIAQAAAKAREDEAAWTEGGKTLMGSAARYVAQHIEGLLALGPDVTREED